MEYGKFIISGEDKNTLSTIKNILVSNDHVFVGYAKQAFNILRYIRGYTPDFVILEITNNFRNMKPVLEVIDEELLTACILLLDRKSDEIFHFIKSSKIMTYMVKPVYEDMVLQTVDLSLMTLERTHEYEKQVKKLSDTLENRKVIDKAKWLLVQYDGLSEGEAYEKIKKKSRDNRISMREIADAIILAKG